MKTANFINLSDGRKLGFAEYGDPKGIPVFHFHGFPASRLEVQFMDGAACLLGVRLISADRPGIGLSQFARWDSILDWPRDVAQLADALGIDRFHVMGISGGGPYALACAYALPHRILNTGVVCGLGPPDLGPGLHALKGFNRMGIELAGKAPGLLKPLMAVCVPVFHRHPRLLITPMTKTAPASDRMFLDEPVVRQMIHGSFRETFRQGFKGPMQQLRLYTRPWGFDLQRVRTPVYLWHGKADSIVPLSMARLQQSAIPGCKAFYYPGEGHFSILANHATEILATLAQQKG